MKGPIRPCTSLESRHDEAFCRPFTDRRSRCDNNCILIEADGTRTRNVRIDSPVLYPIELRPLGTYYFLPPTRSWGL